MEVDVHAISKHVKTDTTADVDVDLTIGSQLTVNLQSSHELNECLQWLWSW